MPAVHVDELCLVERRRVFLSFTSLLLFPNFSCLVRFISIFDLRLCGCVFVFACVCTCAHADQFHMHRSAS